MELARRGRKRRLGVEDKYWQLILAGVGTVEACTLVGIGRKTGYRWRAERGGLPPFVVIGQPAAQAAVDNYLRATGPYARYPGPEVAVEVQGHTVSVYLSMPYELPVPVPGVARTTTIHAEGSSVMPIY